MKTRTLVVLALSLAAAGCQVATEAEPDTAPGMRRDGGTTMGSGNRSDGAVADDTLVVSATTRGGNMMGSGNRPEGAAAGDTLTVTSADALNTGMGTSKNASPSETSDGGNTMGSGNRSDLSISSDSTVSVNGADLLPLADSAGPGEVTEAPGGSMMGSGN